MMKHLWALCKFLEIAKSFSYTGEGLKGVFIYGIFYSICFIEFISFYAVYMTNTGLLMEHTVFKSYYL